MYINEVLNQVEQYYPNEYSRMEMYRWCDEVSAMLTQETIPCYKEICLPLDKSNEILIPEDINIERIYEIRAGNRIISKQDLRTFGVEKLHAKDCQSLVIDTVPKNISDVRVIYLAPYERIRTIKYVGDVSIREDKCAFIIPYAEFRAGDIVDVSLLNSDGSVETKERLNIYGRSYDIETDCYVYETNNISEITNSNNAKIIRYVTDRTVCDAPYDTMYVDYIMARIAQYQRDVDKQNIYRVDFNSKLISYKNWLADKLPRDEDKLINWW